jgi:hypothetical protein
LAAGKPLLGWHNQPFLIIDQDESGSPPLGRVPSDDTTRLYRPQGEPAYPWGLLIFDRPITPLTAGEADCEAIRFAIALANDQAPTPSPRYTTGRGSYRAWAALLRSQTRRTQARHQEKMLSYLKTNRSAAVAFLHELATRHPGRAAAHLAAAADLYQQLLDDANTADPADLDTNPQSRQRLADLVGHLAELDAQAATELQLALPQMSNAGAAEAPQQGK